MSKVSDGDIDRFIVMIYPINFLCGDNNRRLYFSIYSYRDSAVFRFRHSINYVTRSYNIICRPLIFWNTEYKTATFSMKPILDFHANENRTFRLVIPLSTCMKPHSIASPELSGADFAWPQFARSAGGRADLSATIPADRDRRESRAGATSWSPAGPAHLQLVADPGADRRGGKSEAGKVRDKSRKNQQD